MHARASIPAWARLFAISAAIVAVLTLLVAAPWRSSERGPCAALLSNIELVKSGSADRRTSDAFVFRQNDRGRVRVETTDGDFSGAMTLDGLRSCLGTTWTETHAAAQAEAYGDAWVFSRVGEPLVMYVQERSEHYWHVEAKIVVERAD